MGNGNNPKIPVDGSGERKLSKQTTKANPPSLCGGPTTPEGKEKSRLNAIKHGIFAVGVIRSRESEADYQRVVEDLIKSLDPEGRLEELLVEKLAMLAWRYRRFLQAEAAEIFVQSESCAQAYREKKKEAATEASKTKGLIRCAVADKNDMALEMSIASIEAIRRDVGEKGLDWQRDEESLRRIYGPLEERNGKVEVAVVGKYRVGSNLHISWEPLSKRYRETVASRDPDRWFDSDSDEAKDIAQMLTQDIERLKRQLREWCEAGDRGNEIEESRSLLPSKEVIDRLQRYEASLERSFDRTLSQLERLQRTRRGQPVAPNIQVDINH